MQGTPIHNATKVATQILALLSYDMQVLFQCNDDTGPNLCTILISKKESIPPPISTQVLTHYQTK